MKAQSSEPVHVWLVMEQGLQAIEKYTLGRIQQAGLGDSRLCAASRDETPIGHDLVAPLEQNRTEQNVRSEKNSSPLLRTKN
jgi:hypothetical protein